MASINEKMIEHQLTCFGRIQHRIRNVQTKKKILDQKEDINRVEGKRKLTLKK